MKLPLRSVAWLLPLLLTACFHKAPKTRVAPLAPPVQAAPQAQPVQAAEPPPPVAAAPAQLVAPVATAATQPQEKPKPPVAHHKPAAKPAQVASSGSPGVSAIGQLSSGEPSDLRRQTSDSILATDRALNGIPRKLNDQEQRTAAQIREFLKQARAALASGDVDGARTLASKAKVLLGEINR